MQSDSGEDGVPLVVEGIQGPTEAIVVELVRRDVPEEGGAGSLRPVGDVAQSDGLRQSSGQKQSQKRAISILGLGVGGEMMVNDVGDAHAFEQGSDNGQGAEMATLLTRGRTEPVDTHGKSPDPWGLKTKGKRQGGQCKRGSNILQ